MSIAGTTKARAARKASSSQWWERVARAGLVGRGLLHGLIGLMALRIAAGEPQEQADQRGALAAVARQPLGRVLVLAIAASLLAYAAWRLLEAVVDPEDVGPLKRVGLAARGLLYLGFSWTALSLSLAGSKAQGGHEQQDITARVLAWPFGQALVVVVGLVVIGVGLWNGWRIVSRSYEKELKEYEMSPQQCRWAKRVAQVGLLARMMAFALSGGFLVRAALRYDPQEAVGLDASLHQLATKPAGPPLLVFVGVGLIAFGIFQLVLARYRRVLGS